MDLSIPLCVLSLLLLGYSYAQEVEITPNGEEVVRKADAEPLDFVCRVKGAQPTEDPGFEWLDKNDEIIGQYDPNPNSKRYRIYTSRFGSELELNFAVLKDGDEGTYTCRGTVNGNEVSKYKRLIVYEGISMSSPLIQSPKIYTDAKIYCEAKASASPKVVWMNQDRQIISGPRYVQEKTYLLIKNITQADNGIYICRVRTQDDRETKKFNINVTVTIPPKMKGPPVISDPIVDQDFTMSCLADGTPRPTFTFWKGGSLLSGKRFEVSVTHEQLVTRGNLVIKGLKDTDEGEYTCQAENAADKVEETVFVDTIVRPNISEIRNQTAAEGSPAELKCVTRADPAADVTWMIFGTNVPLSDDPDLGITVDTSSEEEPLIHVVTSTIKFSKLKPVNTNNYTCTATNIAGTVKKDGSVIVEFKPIFKNTPYSSVYGWATHNTEIKCVADAVPVPSISWRHQGKEIKEGGAYKLSSVRGVRQLTGTLTVSVNVENEKNVFGIYSCVAVNYQGERTHNITLLKARTPNAPVVSIEDVLPTSIKLLIVPPTDNGGQPVLDYKVEYHEELKPANIVARMADVSQDAEEPRTKFTIEGLKAKTTYLITVSARNKVGYGTEATVDEDTPAVQRPGIPEITSSEKSDGANSYLLTWKIPRTGGANITHYNIAYHRVEMGTGENSDVKVVGEMKEDKLKDGSATSFKLEGLFPNSYYEVELSASNLMGKSLSEKITFRTLPGGMPTTNEQPAMATGAIIGIIIAVIIILFIVIDVTFYFTKQCGLLWTLKGKVAGGEGGGERTDAEATDHEKEAFIKDGKQDSEEPSAKENVDVVNETEKGDEKEKELEPEDKEEKVETEPAPEPAKEAEEDGPPAGSPQTESAPPDTSTEPAQEAAAQDVPEKDPKV